MKFKPVCASIAVTTSIATGMVFVPQSHTLAQNKPTQTEQINSRRSGTLEMQWILGFIPWPTWARSSNSSRSQNSGNSNTYANNPSNPKLTNIGKPNNSKPIDTKQGYNQKQVPVPVLIPGLAALGIGLICKNRQASKQIEMK
ncbi:hypothetical protein NIES21_04600 [Anabaenopsis circularis NIES-21]|uniref:Uncharacterized protein n=2 Tax=Nostocales TaxID=1161 RepID=A0A1Z4GB37_9CYAN|nr:hypothetical protein [Nostoc cycadae]BAY14702.1 hypothetical protein NIES21_04600 [Anabaenopsis circularis NIES-21]GBE92378.1 hypothetical protein NCWK1_2133 [Nostoc cycadae WK-1]